MSTLSNDSMGHGFDVQRNSFAYDQPNSDWNTHISQSGDCQLSGVNCYAGRRDEHHHQFQNVLGCTLDGLPAVDPYDDLCSKTKHPLLYNDRRSVMDGYSSNIGTLNSFSELSVNNQRLSSYSDSQCGKSDASQRNGAMAEFYALQDSSHIGNESNSFQASNEHAAHDTSTYQNHAASHNDGTSPSAILTQTSETDSETGSSPLPHRHQSAVDRWLVDSEGSTRSSSNSSVSSSEPENFAEHSAENEFLVKKKQAGWTYKEIKRAYGFRVAESTLRGRYRALTKPKEKRPRKPFWSGKDVREY